MFWKLELFSYSGEERETIILFDPLEKVTKFSFISGTQYGRCLSPLA
jgi:hypothetical protein